MLVVLARRTGEQQPDDALIAEIALDALSPAAPSTPVRAAAGMLVRERLGEGAESFVSACHRMTSGNPLLLRSSCVRWRTRASRPTCPTSTRSAPWARGRSRRW